MDVSSLNIANIANIGMNINRREDPEGSSSGEKGEVSFRIEDARQDFPSEAIEPHTYFTVSNNSQPKTGAGQVGGKDVVEAGEASSDNESPIVKSTEKQVADGPAAPFEVIGGDVAEGESGAAGQSQSEDSGNYTLAGLFKSGQLTLEQLNSLKDGILVSAPEGNGAESAFGGLKPGVVAELVANSSPELLASSNVKEGLPVHKANVFNPGEGVSGETLALGAEVKELLSAVAGQAGEVNSLRIRAIAEHLGVTVRSAFGGLEKYGGQNSNLEKIAVDIEGAGEEQEAIGKVVSDVFKGADAEILSFQGASDGQKVEPIAQGQVGQKSGVVFKGEADIADVSAKLGMNKEAEAVHAELPEGEAGFLKLTVNNTGENQAGLGEGKVNIGEINSGKDVSAKLGGKEAGLESAFGGLGAKHLSSENHSGSSEQAVESFTVESLLQKPQQSQQGGGEVNTSEFSSKNSIGSAFGQAVSGSGGGAEAAETNVSSGAGGTNENILLNSTSAKVGMQLQESIRSSIGSGKGQIIVQLHPPELGKVSLRFVEEEGGLNGFLQVSKAETRYDIEQALPEVIRNLSDSGIQIRRIEVTVAEQNYSQQRGFKDQQLNEDGWRGGDYQQEMSFEGQEQKAEGGNDSGDWRAENTGVPPDFSESAEQLYSGSVMDIWV